MLMPMKIPELLFAPCGMNCMVCYVHLKNKKACDGCLGNDINKPDRCKTCTIKTCAQNKGLKYCYDCCDFPCKVINNMEKSYKKRYGASILENSKHVKERGIIDFQAVEHEKWICTSCRGVVSLHDGICSECGGKHSNYSKILKNNHE